MINLHIESSGEPLDFNTAQGLALSQAYARNMEAPVVVSWRQRSTHRYSPGFDGADEETWWSKYGEGNGGQADISVDQDFDFIIMETGGYETVHSLPLRNLKDTDGIEHLCFTPMLDDSNAPRKDACTPLDDWMADQF